MDLLYDRINFFWHVYEVTLKNRAWTLKVNWLPMELWRCYVLDTKNILALFPFLSAEFCLLKRISDNCWNDSNLFVLWTPEFRKTFRSSSSFELSLSPARFFALFLIKILEVTPFVNCYLSNSSKVFIWEFQLDGVSRFSVFIKERNASNSLIRFAPKINCFREADIYFLEIYCIVLLVDSQKAENGRSVHLPTLCPKRSR